MIVPRTFSCFQFVLGPTTVHVCFARTMWAPSSVATAFLLAWKALVHQRETHVPATLLPSVKTPTSSQSVHLPDTARPTHYDLSIMSDLQDLEFAGGVNITLDILKSTSILEFHAGRNLQLGRVQVQTQDGDMYTVTPTIHHDRERAMVKLPKKLGENERVYLSTGFRAAIDRSLRGFYYSTWAHEGQMGRYALTQFEPTSARRAYPGWDEPAYKANFTFRMLHRVNTTALANMPSAYERSVDKEQVHQLLQTRSSGLSLHQYNLDEWLLTEFETTPKMATYLVAWANGAFLHVSNTTISPLTGRVIPLRMYTTPDLIHQAAFSTEAMAKILPEYEKIFEIAYPLPKLDALVAADFDFGAMENWGLITGRSSIFMHDESMGLRGMKNTAGVMSHEIAHMWFGDIATIAWWESLWLNEAFATFMGEVIVLDRVFPAWKSASEFVVMHWMRALQLDAKRSSHQIEIPLQSERVEDEITQVFDDISYSKGASVLRMLSHMLGKDVFLRGVSLYLKKHLYGSTVTADLWDGISQAAGIDVNTIMSNWILQQGFPVISATEKGDSIYVEQHRFLQMGDPTPEEDSTLWHVPLGLKTKKYVDSKSMLRGQRSMHIPFERANSSFWKLNADTTGVYRVVYTPEHLARLGEVASLGPSSPLSVEDRVGLVDDAYSLAHAGYSRTSSALTLTRALHGETSSLVLQALALKLEQLSSAWWEQAASVRVGLNQFRADLFGPLARKLSFNVRDEDSTETRELRTTVISAAAAAGDAWTLGEIHRRFTHWQDTGDDSLIHPDVLRTVLSEAVKHGDAQAYKTVLQLYHAPPTPLHRTCALMALGSVQRPDLIARTLSLVFDGGIKTQDYTYIFNALSSNTFSRRVLWNETKKHFDELSKRLEGNFSLMGVVKAAISALSSEEDLADIQRFFAHRSTTMYHMSLAQGLESVLSQSRWIQRDAEDVQQWLFQHHYLPTLMSVV